MCLLLLVLLLPSLLSEVAAATVASKFCGDYRVTCSNGVITGATGNFGNLYVQAPCPLLLFELVVTCVLYAGLVPPPVY